MRRLLRNMILAIGWLLIGVVVLIMIAGLVVQTKPVKNKISQIAEKRASQFVSGEVKIGKISGNFFSTLRLENVLWTNHSDTVAFVESLNASYRLLPLLHGELFLQSVEVENPYFNLKQEMDSTWNIQHLIPQDRLRKEDTTTTSNEFRIILSNFKLTQGRLGIQAFDTLIPREIRSLDIDLMLDYASDKQLLRLKNIAFQTKQPNFQVVQLSFNILRSEETVSLSDFYIKTAQNAATGEAKYTDRPIFDAAATLESEPINFHEFEFFTPGINLPANPKLSFKSETSEGALDASLSLVDQDQKIRLDLFSENFSDFVLNPQNAKLKYRFTGAVENIYLAHWLGNQQLNYKLNGKFNVNGKGTDPKSADVNFDAELYDCVFDTIPVEDIKMNLHFVKGNLDGNITGDGSFGKVSITSKINDLFGNPAYHIQANTRNLNIAPLFGSDSLHSDLNLTAQVEGNGFDPNKLKANAEISLSRSSIRGYVVDSLVGKVRYAQKNIEIDTLWANARSLHVKANGNYSLEGNSDVRLNVAIDSIQPFWDYIPLDSIYGGGTVNVHLLGAPDSLSVQGIVELKNINFSDVTAETITINGTGKLVAGDTTFSANMYIGKLETGGFGIDSVVATSDYFSDSLSVEARVSGEELQSTLKSQIFLGDTLKVKLSDFDINFMKEHLELVEAPAMLEIDSVAYRLSNFKMASGIADSAQFIKAEGAFSMTGTEDFHIEITNFDVGQLLESVGQKMDVSGKVNAKAVLSGTAQLPELTGDFSVNNAQAYAYRFSELGGDFNLSNNRFRFRGQVVPLDSGKFDLTASIPVTASFDSLDFAVNPKDSINATLLISRFPLSVLQFLKSKEQVKGVLDGKVDVAGTLESPDTKGNLRLLDAEVIMPEYGIDYRNIVFDLNFSKDAARLDSFYIKSPDGTLKASGTIDFNSAFYKGDISQSEVSIHFNRFNPFNHRQFNMQLSGDAGLKGKAGEVVFNGKLIVPQAEIYLPALMNLTGRMTAPEIPEPILVRELEKLSQQPDSSLAVTVDLPHATKDTFRFNYLDNFTGKLNIQFPQNTWIKNKDLFVEISGDLDLMKNNEFFELFGTIDVVRGQYDLLGKTFKIDEGTITFQGGEDVMPLLNIAASYSFRNSNRAEQRLSVVISGKATEPAIEFSLDGSRIGEGDALSYILFGRAMNELTIDQQENVSGAGQLAGSAAMALLSSQLTDLLGSSLNVDYIEVKGNGDFENATVVVGKYITNDLFVSYEQRFGETDEKDMAKYEVKLEYELFRFLFLQLNNSSTDSGFDLILKLNSK